MAGGAPVKNKCPHCGLKKFSSLDSFFPCGTTDTNYCDIALRLHKPVRTLFCQTRARLVDEFPDVTESEVYEVIEIIHRDYLEQVSEVRP